MATAKQARPTMAGTKPPPAAKHLNQLKARLLEISDLGAAGGVLSWDQSTYMPPGGAKARGRQMARLAEIAHKKRVDPARTNWPRSLRRSTIDLTARTTSLPPRCTSSIAIGELPCSTNPCGSNRAAARTDSLSRLQ